MKLNIFTTLLGVSYLVVLSRGETDEAEGHGHHHKHHHHKHHHHRHEHCDFGCRILPAPFPEPFPVPVPVPIPEVPVPLPIPEVPIIPEVPLVVPAIPIAAVAPFAAAPIAPAPIISAPPQDILPPSKIGSFPGNCGLTPISDIETIGFCEGEACRQFAGTLGPKSGFAPVQPCVQPQANIYPPPSNGNFNCACVPNGGGFGGMGPGW